MSERKPAKHRQTWTAEEDRQLTEAVLKHKPGKQQTKVWKIVATEVPGRTYAACQGRWNAHLDPQVDRSPWTPEKDQQLLELFKNPETNSWSKRGRAMGRGGADVCNRYWYLQKQKGKVKKEEKKTESEEEKEGADDLVDEQPTPPPADKQDMDEENNDTPRKKKKNSGVKLEEGCEEERGGDEAAKRRSSRIRTKRLKREVNL